METRKYLKPALKIEIEAGEMNEQQKRLIRSLNTLLGHLTSTNDESEFFRGTEQAAAIFNMLVKQSNFPTSQGNSEIAYAEQALENAYDNAIEQIYRNSKPVYDN